MVNENEVLKVEEITKEQFFKYLRVQESGTYNMFSPEAIEATGLGKRVYSSIMAHYEELEDMYDNEE
jgi:hypothetical protein